MSLRKSAPIDTTRRCFLRGLLSVPTGAWLSGKEIKLRLRLIKQFANSTLKDVSPDGKNICLYFTKNRVAAFTLQDGESAGESLSGNLSSDVLQVLDTDAWKPVYSTRLRAFALVASFSADGRQLYVQTGPFRESGTVQSQQVMIDLHTGEINRSTKYGLGVFNAIGNGMLLGTENPKHDETLIVKAASDSRELKRERLSRAEGPYRERAGLAFSADRGIVVYSTDQTVICRRTVDLGVLWVRPVEPEFGLPWKMAISADGGTIAAALIDSKWTNTQGRAHVIVLNGKNGALLTRFPLNGQGAVALSHDGSLVAVGTSATEKGSKDILLYVDIFDISSGQQVSRQLHARVLPGRFQNLVGGFSATGLCFTSDGKYLISDAYDSTKVWKLDSEQDRKR
jgi:WD40 repeat protein